ncbi:MAG: hypothetical protein OEY97_11295 [Nitrospirota bacterium]|nr:hypothetical protein [Nitrospirota bacterium]
MNFQKRVPALALAAGFMMCGASVASAAPDLIVTAISAPAQVEQGEQFSASVTLHNQGPDGVYDVAIVNYALFISADTVLDASDICAGTGGVDRSTLEPGSTYTDTFPNYLFNAAGAPTGSYNLIAIADSRCSLGYTYVAESDETNNALTSGTMDLLASTAVIDLTVTLVEGPTNARRGNFVRPYVAIANLGPDPAPGIAPNGCGFYQGLYLSIDATISTADTLVSQTCMARLDGYGVNSGNMDVTIPADFPRGFYYWGVIIDNQDMLGETDEANNWGVSVDRVNIR